VYLFNITNLAAVRRGAKPALAELGPFKYRKWRIKQVPSPRTLSTCVVCPCRAGCKEWRFKDPDLSNHGCPSTL
jgi:hypothetical protein